MVLRHFGCCVFNPEFPKLPNLSVSGGADLGSAIGTKNGHKGDRELLFLGDPANYAAKILTGTDSLRVTTAVYEALPETLQTYFTAVEDDRLGVTVYEINDISTEEMDQLLSEHDIDWDRAASLQRLKDDKLIYPLNRIEYSDAEVQIDIDALGITNKNVCWQPLSSEMYLALRSTSTGRWARMMASPHCECCMPYAKRCLPSRHDFSGIRVQFQGDRVQALFHMPKGDEKRIAARAVDTAIALQSTMELVIKKTTSGSRGIGDGNGVYPSEPRWSQSSEPAAIAIESVSLTRSKRLQGIRRAAPAARLQYRSQSINIWMRSYRTCSSGTKIAASTLEPISLRIRLSSLGRRCSSNSRSTLRPGPLVANSAACSGLRITANQTYR
jgi:hypothetical protein